MALTPTSLGDNPFQPGATAETYVPDQLIAGDLKLVTADVVVTGAAALKRGTVVGLVGIGAASSAAKSGGNTGNGTFTLDVTTPIKANAQSGVYTLRCTAVAANNGTFELKDPKGEVLGEIIMAGGAGAIDDQIKGALADGSNDFVVGDGFDITVAAGSMKVKKAVATAVDGSQVPMGILVDDYDASGGDVAGAVYQMGEFNGNKLIYDGSYTLAAITVALRSLGMFVKSALTASDPS